MEDNDVSADAITNCLKTTRNTLSVWSIKNENDIDKAILAIASNLDHIETIDVVILNDSVLHNFGIKIIASTGNTPIESLREFHRDLSELTFSKIGHIKDHIVERIRNNKLKRFTRGKLIKLLKEAIDKGLLELEDLNDSIRNKLE
ncbi:MAG: hypothetical protein ACTSXT_09565 [Candidatus Helarchaeota archaeon]